MTHSLKTSALAAAILATSFVNPATAENDKVGYGIGVMQCSTITNVIKGKEGEMAMIYYVGGFVSAMNLIGGSGDILNGVTVQDASSSILAYCKTHRSGTGADAIMTVIKASMKDQS